MSHDSRDAWELRFDNDDDPPRWHVDHLLFRSDARARWHADPHTRRRLHRIDFDHLFADDLLQRLLVAQASRSPVVSMRLRPANPSVSWLWARSDAPYRRRLEELTECAVSTAVVRMIQDLGFDRYLLAQIVHHLSLLAEQPDLHAHLPELHIPTTDP